MEPPASRRLFESRRGFCFSKIPPSWAHERTPKRGWMKQKLLLSVLLEIRMMQVAGNRGKTFYCRAMRATSVFASFFELANAKSEFVYFRAKMSRATAPRPLHAPGFQRVLDPLVSFLSPFLCGTTKKWHKTGTAQREAVCASVEEVVAYTAKLKNPPSRIYHAKWRIAYSFYCASNRCVPAPSSMTKHPSSSGKLDF